MHVTTLPLSLATTNIRYINTYTPRYRSASTQIIPYQICTIPIWNFGASKSVSERHPKCFKQHTYLTNYMSYGKTYITNCMSRIFGRTHDWGGSVFQLRREGVSHLLLIFSAVGPLPNSPNIWFRPGIGGALPLSNYVPYLCERAVINRIYLTRNKLGYDNTKKVRYKQNKVLQ